MDRLSRQANALRGAFAAIGAGLVVREFSRLLDVTTTIDNQIRLVTNNTEELTAVYGELFNISQRTRTSIADNAEIFQKLGVATRDLGLSYREQLGLLEQLNQTLIISGTNAQQGAAALRQLGQALASGALRGDEFISVSENIPKLLDVVVDELNRTSDGVRVTRGDLRDLASEGELTAELIVRAFQNANLDEEFAKITPTIQGAFTVFNNELINFTRNINNAGAIGEIFARAVLFLAENFNAVAGAAAGLAIVMVGALIPAIVTMTAALLLNPFGIIVVAIAAATAALGAFGDTSVTVGGQTATVWQIIKAAVMTTAQVFGTLLEVATTVYNGIADGANEFFSGAVGQLRDWLRSWGITFDSVLAFAKAFINSSIGLHVGLLRAIGSIVVDGIPAVFMAAYEGAKSVVLAALQFIINATVNAIGGLGDALDAIPGIDGVGDSIREALTVDFSDSISSVQELGDILGEAGGRIQGAFGSAQQDYVGAFGDAVGGAATTLRDQFNTNLTEVIANTEASADVNEILNRTLDGTAESGGAAAGSLNDVAGGAGSASEAAQELEERMERLNTLFNEINGISPELNTRVQDLQTLLSMGAISTQQFNRELMNTNLQMLELKAQTGEGTFADGFLLELGRMTEGVQNFQVEAGGIFGQFFDTFSQGFADSIGQAIWDTDDLGESLKKVARQAISQLISSFIQLGIQMVANKVLGLTLGATATAASAAQAGALASAWAPAAALASLATSGANSAGASAGITGTMGLARGLAAAGGGFADGGLIGGMGGPRSDLNLAAVSRGEYIVNAAATRKNLGALEAMNNGEEMPMRRGGGTTIMNITTPNADSFQASRSQILQKQRAAQQRTLERDDR